jgi:hypothetical protein
MQPKPQNAFCTGREEIGRWEPGRLARYSFTLRASGPRSHESRCFLGLKAEGSSAIGA